MSVDELKTALTGSGIDVLDFDMCLMAGYETLVKVGDLVSQVVFSEEVVPGAGNPYASIIDGLQADPTMTPREVSQLIVDRFDASYQETRLLPRSRPTIWPSSRPSFGCERRGNGTLGRGSPQSGPR